jgi:hypothetical protein
VAAFCEHGDERSASIKGGHFFLAEQLLASQEEMNSTESLKNKIALLFMRYLHRVCEVNA